MAHPSTLTAVGLAARLDRLSINPLHRRVIVVVLVAFVFEIADQSAIGLAATGVRTHLGVSIDGIALAIGATYLGVALGAMGGGWLSDRIGRKLLLTIGLVGMSVLSGVTALAYDLASLVVLRTLTGLALGATWIVAGVYLAETIPARRRGIAISLMVSAGGLGAVLLAVVARIMIPVGDIGWRTVFGVGLIGLLVVPALLRLPESPRWLLIRGRSAEAESVLHQFEAASGVQTSGDGYEDVVVAEPEQEPEPEPVSGSAARSWWALLRPPLLRGTVLVAVCWVFFTALGQVLLSWSPTILDLRGFDPASALTIVALLPFGIIVGSLLATTIINRIRAYFLLIGLALLGAVSTLGFGLVAAPVILTAAGMVFGFTVGLFGSGLNTYMMEQFPTEVRGRGTGFAWSIGRASSVAAPFAVAAALAAFGPSSIAWGAAGAWMVIALAVAVLGRRTPPGESLEVVDPTGGAAEADAAPAAVHRPVD